MIINDNEAYNIVLERLEDDNLSIIEYNVLMSVALLMKDYSFTSNQTYPRPSHPDIKKRKDAYFTLIAIVLSLRTTLENEQKAVNLFIKEYNSINDVVDGDILKLKKIISCAGMPEKKSQVILKISKIILNKYSGNINNINDGDILKTRNRLLELPGIGEKSADCMLELAFNLPSIVVDINVFRVITRLFFEDQKLSFQKKQDILKVKSFLEENIIRDFRIFQIVHTILLLHGKYICKSKPNCEKCKLNNQCNYNLKRNENKQLSLF